MDKPVCPGFSAAGIAAHIKKNGDRDLGIIVSRVPASVAGVFTRNKVQAAPVVLDRQRVQGGGCRAIIANSGNANCCTGRQGMQDALNMARMAAVQLDIPEAEVLVASTGVIGAPLPMGAIENGILEVVRSICPGGFPDFARAIMTTDTVPKLISRTIAVGGGEISLVATAKGAGMIRPDMATLLCFVVTDAQAAPAVLKDMLTRATAVSFNRMSIDGDTSTNDTALMMANGLSGVCIDHGADKQIFQQALIAVFKDLARQLVRDGEGVTKLVDVVVRGAASEKDAEKVADTVAHSNLVKTAFFGEDANWGRILGAVGRAGIPVSPDRIDVFFDAVQMVKNGEGCGPAAEAMATEVLKTSEFTVVIDLNAGQGTWSCLTCDFSIDYVKINADYRS